MASQQLQEYVIFVGNPGVGKSTLLNSLIGKKMFKSGLSFGSGLTKEFKFEYHQGIAYGDTPGLFDVARRKEAASNITEALKKHGKYKLVFVINLRSGRPIAEDLTTIQVVLEAINDGSFPYGVIINKASKQVIKKLEDKENKEKLYTALNLNHFPTDQFFVQPEINEAIDEDGFLFTASPELVSFLDQLESKLVLPEHVKQVQSQELDELTKQNEILQQEIQANNEKLWAEREKQRKKLQEYSELAAKTEGLSVVVNELSRFTNWINREAVPFVFTGKTLLK